MNYYSGLSTYLVRPRLQARRRFSTGTFLRRTSEANLAKLSRILAATVLWAGIASIAGLQIPAAKPAVASKSAPKQPAVSKPAAPAHAVLAKVLPGGPSGQLLPPGSPAAAPAPTRIYLASASLRAANSYSWGQCTWYVAARRNVPSGWGNANQWYYHAKAAGWPVGTSPAPGAIAWTGAGWYGHVAYVEQVSAGGASVYISEMNYRGVGVKSYRWVSASSFKYIY